MINHVFLNTGSPHHVQFEEHIEDFDIKTKGAKIRYGAPYNEAGSNVILLKRFQMPLLQLEPMNEALKDETLSCGTGVTAVAIAMNFLGETNKNLSHVANPRWRT